MKLIAKTKGAVLVATTLLACQQVVAQEQQDITHAWEFAGHVAFAALDKKVALSQGIDDYAFTVGFSVDYLQNGWVTSGKIDILVYDDNAGFTQEVEGQGVFNNGDRSTASSNATAALLSLASGYQWYLGEEQEAAVRLQAGFSVVTASERAIELCTDCYSEKIDINGGVFVSASAQRHVGSVVLGVYFQQFLSGDINNQLGLTISSGF
ncbi:MAG: hypothetical protein GW763_01080 [Paraglaciecola sp.]|nr:hypothetical protein [Paraglaciecola sp.]NCT46586.1 hypothetical protein [Paraglaciecola sp.]